MSQAAVLVGLGHTSLKKWDEYVTVRKKNALTVIFNSHHITSGWPRPLAETGFDTKRAWVTLK